MAIASAETLRPADFANDSARTPPHNDEAEMALVGALLQNNRAFERVSEFLKPEYFANRIHGRLFEAIGKLIEKGQIADQITLRQYFEADGDLAEVGGWPYIMQISHSVVSIINAEDYGRTIHDLYLRRQLIDLGEELVNDAFASNLESDAKAQIEAAEQHLFSLAETGDIEGGFRPFKEALAATLRSAEAAHRRAGGLAGLTTGFDDLDKMLGGLHPSDLLILAARPSMGKTALATNIAFNAARAEMVPFDGEPDAGKAAHKRNTIAFFSLEMSAEQLATRILAEVTGIASERIRRGELSSDEFERLVIGTQEIEKLALFIDDTPALSVSALRTRARRLKRQHGLSMIVVDYLQLMRGSSDAENRVQEISEITRGLKAIAKELNVPVVALSQLSRAVENREDKRPQLADLRESGTIEQDADVVMFIFREQYYLERAEPMQRADETTEKWQERHDRWKIRCDEVYNLAEVLIAKQRHGPVGKISLQFEGQTTKFSNYIPPDHLPDAQF
jgi:replicative DNA helicase